MSFIGITEKEKQEMLQTIGVSSVDDLFADIPASIQLKVHPDLPKPVSEQEISDEFTAIGEKNSIKTSFLGAGVYGHYIPAVVNELASRSEFYTAYTPYQPEVSQGTLTAIFEFQTMLCSLTGMDMTNASMYDGATAMAEAALMSSRIRKKDKILVSRAVHPHYREVLKTYAWASGMEIEEIALENGKTPPGKTDQLLDETVCGVIVQNPNFFGSLEDLKALSEVVHRKKAHLVVTITEPLSLGMLKSPGEFEADIVCGEAASFGNGVGFGGPMLGFISAAEKFTRKVPGRLVGKTTDLDGNEAYVLTLQTREQHIRRERATSNICTNEGLLALRAVLYLGMYGKRLKELAELNHRTAGYLKKQLESKGLEPVFSGPYFNEFVLKTKKAQELLAQLKEKGILGGLALETYYPEYSDCILFCATELNTKEEIDTFVTIVEKLLS
ncbi:MAG: aminomethyl-transferring glycine dehydrogenase subunit GcvPA [bacterium]|nr:aminomethyl-transferring glycine dehydrogenase subunit GcvPA [bacterium]